MPWSRPSTSSVSCSRKQMRSWPNWVCWDLGACGCHCPHTLSSCHSLLSEEDGVPKTTLYSMGLDTLALCLAEAGGAQGPSVALARQVLSPESHLSVGKEPLCSHIPTPGIYS